MPHAPDIRHAQAGYTALELAIALVVLGMVFWAGSSSLANVRVAAERQQAQVELASLAQRLRVHVLQEGRLPCPDADGDGWADGCEATPAVEVGDLPYRSLGIDPPPPGARVRYGVFRAAGPAATDIDLARRMERTGDAPGSAGFADLNDVLAALGRLGVRVPTADHPRLTGDGAATGAVDCAGNVRSNPAFLLWAPLQDRDGDGQRLDGLHTAVPGCAVPGQAAAQGDDQIFAEPADVLAGWLSRQTRQ